MNRKLLFLTAPRFWAMVVATVTIYLEAKGLIGVAETVLIASLSAGFWATQTVDRLGENIGN